MLYCETIEDECLAVTMCSHPPCLCFNHFSCNKAWITSFIFSAIHHYIKRWISSLPQPETPGQACVEHNLLPTKPVFFTELHISSNLTTTFLKGLNVAVSGSEEWLWSDEPKAQSNNMQCFSPALEESFSARTLTAHTSFTSGAPDLES